MAIAGNEFTRQGLAGIVPILTTDTWHGYFGEEVELLPGRPLPPALPGHFCHGVCPVR